MWQIYSYLAHEHIEEQLQEARRQRRRVAPERRGARSRLHLPASLKRSPRTSSRPA